MSSAGSLMGTVGSIAGTMIGGPGVGTAIGGALGSAVGGMIGGHAASQQSGAGQGLMNQQMGLQQQNIASTANFQNQQQQTYGPLEQQLVQQASSDQPLFYGAMKGAVNQNFDQGQRNLQTQMAQRGMAGSGLAAGGATGMELGRSGALDTAFQQGLQSRLQLGQSVLSRYQPMLNQSMMSQALGGASGTAGMQAQMHNTAAQQGWQNAGSAMGSAGTLMSLGMGGMGGDSGVDPSGMGNSAAVSGVNINSDALGSYDGPAPQDVNFNMPSSSLLESNANQFASGGLQMEPGQMPASLSGASNAQNLPGYGYGFGPNNPSISPTTPTGYPGGNGLYNGTSPPNEVTNFGWPNQTVFGTDGGIA